MTLKIFFRANESAKSAGSINADITKENFRYKNYTKKDILKAVWLSVNNGGVTDDDHITIFVDAVSSETIEWMLKTVKTKNVQIKEVPPLDTCPPFETHPFPHLHPIRINCSKTLFEIFYAEIEKGKEEDIFYLCEDDYLHRPSVISCIKNLYENGYRGFFLPYDYPDRYTIDKGRQCDVVLGPTCHLRSVPSATFTMMADQETWLNYKLEALRGSVFCDDSWTWKAFKQTNAFCPIPGWACHFQEGYISPYIDWDTIFAEAMYIDDPYWKNHALL